MQFLKKLLRTRKRHKQLQYYHLSLKYFSINLKFTFLGTGTSQGVPIIGCECEVCQSLSAKDKRLRVAMLVESEDTTIVIDTGPDFRQQMLRAGVKKLDAVLLTHEHNDHIIGIDDVRPFNFRQKQDIPVYADVRVQNELKQRFAYIFKENPYPGIPQLSLHSISKKQAFQINEIPIIPIEVIHGNLPVLGFRFGDVTYITDARTIEPEEMEKIKGTRILILNALHQYEHYSHFNLEGALEVVEQLKPEQTYLTHISHHMGLAKEINQQLPSNVQLAYDEQVFSTQI